MCIIIIIMFLSVILWQQRSDVLDKRDNEISTLVDLLATIGWSLAFFFFSFFPLVLIKLGNSNRILFLDQHFGALPNRAS